METKHTSGPWKISTVLSDRNNTCITNIGENQVVIGHTNKPEDAKIISAAPEMLDALNEVITWAKVFGLRHDVYEKVSNAIKKATE